MTFEKIPLDTWKTLTQEEKDYHTLEFNKSVEVRKRWVIIVTRILALIFIGVLFYMGYVQLQSVKNYNEKLDKYGTMGFCALCGEYNLKKCECQYYKFYDYDNKYMGAPNLTNISQTLAGYNLEECKPYFEYVQDKVLDLTNFTSTLSFNSTE